MAKLVLHKITVGVAPAAQTFFFMAPDGLYEGLTSETGVDKVTADTDKDEPRIAVKELLGRGKVVRVSARCKDGLRFKTYGLLVGLSKLETALGSLPGKTVKGAVCSSAGIKRRMSFY